MDDALLQIVAAQGPTTALLLYGLVQFLRGKVHSDAEFQALRADRDQWMDRADRALGVAERGATVAQVTSPRAQRRR